MTNINLDIAKTLDGSQTHMMAIMVDSWGDKLVINLNCETHNWAADYFQPCAHCGNAVLVCNFDACTDCCDRCTHGHKSGFVPTTTAILDKLLVHTLPEDRDRINRIADKCTAKSSTDCMACDLDDTLCPRQERGYKDKESAMIDMTDRKLDLSERIAYAVQQAEDAFWAEVVKVFPEATDGAFLMSDMEDIMLSWVRHWVDNNVPKYQTYRGEHLTELHLNYNDWHILHTGGGCMVAISSNMEVNGRHYFIGVNGELVCIYEDRFDDHFMEEHIRVWEFGTNPTVLMNYFDEIFGFIPDFDACKMFDDCMTIGKSTAV